MCVHRFFHAVSCYICGFAALAYMYMVGGNGMVVVDGRPFFWVRTLHARTHARTLARMHARANKVRYADWMITTPLLLMDLLGLCGVQPSHLPRPSDRN